MLLEARDSAAFIRRDAAFGDKLFTGRAQDLFPPRALLLISARDLALRASMEFSGRMSLNVWTNLSPASSLCFKVRQGLLWEGEEY